MELVIASSSVDSGISCWDIHTGAEQLRYKACTSPSHGLTCVGGRFIASSQLRDSSASSGSILYWSWNKPTAEVKSFPAEPISPLVSNSDGTYIIGGGSLGDIYFWEVASGNMLKKWHAHYRAVTCLVLSEDESLLVSGSDDGEVCVWSLLKIFDDIGNKVAKNTYEHKFSEHTLRVTDLITGYGGCNALIISSSEDRTCKVWSMSKGKLLRTINFPSIIDAIALDPGEHVFYAGSKDGKIYIASLNGENTSNSTYGLHIIGALSDYSKPVMCLAVNMDGNLLVAGLFDGTIRVLDTRTRQVVRTVKHSKCPVNNIVIVNPSLYHQSSNSQISRRNTSSIPPPLDKYLDSKGDNIDLNPKVKLPTPLNATQDAVYISSGVMNNQIKELQNQGSSADSETKLENLQLQCKTLEQELQKAFKINRELLKFVAEKVVDGPN
ncbi:hypothetical protein ACHQM5_023419 [Ranunculus cassubicifolius]